MEVVNGYVCNNCTDVANAKRFVDPAHPKDGPNGANKAEASKDVHGADRGPAVSFAGALAAAQQAQAPQAQNGVEPVRQSPYVPGSSITLKV